MKSFKQITKYLFPVLLLSLFLKNSFAIEYGGVGGRPANPRLDEPRSESIFIHNVSGGDLIKEGVKVINNTSFEKSLIVYSADYTSSTDGGFACKQMGEDKLEVGSWINMSKSEVTLAPNSNEIVDFDISIPSNVSPGEHNGCILIQEKTVNKNESGISLALRTGMRVLLTVKGEIKKSLEFLSFQVVKNQKDNYFLIPEVKNTGNVSVMSDIKVYIKDIFNRNIQEFGGSYSVLKDDISRWNFEFNRPFWGGYFKANSIIRYDNNGDVVLTSNDIWFFVPPTTKALLIIFAALLPILTLAIYNFIYFIVLSSKRKNWIEYLVKSGDTLEILSSTHSVSWKTITKVNRLKPPYILKQGDTILLPRNKDHAKKNSRKK